MKPLLLVLGCLSLPATLHTQTSPPPTGTVIGHALYADTQRPARLATVVLQPMAALQSPLRAATAGEYSQEGSCHLQKTNLDGSFTITAVPPGSYYVILEQDGCVSPLTLFTREQMGHPDEALARRIARYVTTVSVAAGSTSQAEVRLVRGAVIAGNVHFEDGTPVVGVGMALLQRDSKGAWTTVRTDKVGSHISSYTDDRGAYRFTGLPEGEYIARATVELSSITTNHLFNSTGGTSTYYGDGYRLRVFPADTFRPQDAKPFKVQEGENITNADIDIPLSRLYTVTGTVRRPASAGVVNQAHLTLNFTDDGTEAASADVDSNDGSFRFDFVPGGSYTLKATSIADVERTQVATCKNCMPPSHVETKVITSYGNASQAIEITSDKSGVSVEAGNAQVTPRN